MSFGGGRGGAIASPDLKKKRFSVFLHTFFFMICNPLGSRSKFCTPLEINEIASLQRHIIIHIIYYNSPY